MGDEITWRIIFAVCLVTIVSEPFRSDSLLTSLSSCPHIYTVRRDLRDFLKLEFIYQHFVCECEISFQLDLELPRVPTSVFSTQCQMHSIFISSTADAPPGVSGVSKDQKFHAKSDFGNLKR